MNKLIEFILSKILKRYEVDVYGIQINVKDTGDKVNIVLNLDCSVPYSVLEHVIDTTIWQL